MLDFETLVGESVLVKCTCLASKMTFDGVRFQQPDVGWLSNGTLLAN